MTFVQCLSCHVKVDSKVDSKVTKPIWLCHLWHTLSLLSLQLVNDIFPTEINDLLCDELLMDQHASLQSIQRVGHKRSGKYIHKLRFLQDLTGLWQPKLVKFGVMHQKWRLPPLFDQCQALSVTKWQSDKQPCFVTLTAKLAFKFKKDATSLDPELWTLEWPVESEQTGLWSCTAAIAAIVLL